MDYKMKKESFLEALKKMNLLHTFKTLKDTDNELILQSLQPLEKDSVCVVTVRLDESFFNTIHFVLCELKGKDDESHKHLKNILLNLLNDLNKYSCFFNYYLDSHTDKEAIVARTTYLTTNDNFVGEELAGMLLPAFNTLCKDFTKIMNTLNYNKIS